MATASKSLSATQIWTTEPGEKRSVGVIHIVITALLIGIGFVVGAFGSISFPLGFGVNFFWTGIAVQQVGSIWFGAWGVIAGTIFPFFSNAIAGTPFYVSFAYMPANFIQAFLPAWAFRTFKADPRLISGRDYLILLGLHDRFKRFWRALVDAGRAAWFRPAHDQLCPPVHLGLVWRKPPRRSCFQLHSPQSTLSSGYSHSCLCKEVVCINHLV